MSMKSDYLTFALSAGLIGAGIVQMASATAKTNNLPPVVTCEIPDADAQARCQDEIETSMATLRDMARIEFNASAIQIAMGGGIAVAGAMMRRKRSAARA